MLNESVQVYNNLMRNRNSRIVKPSRRKRKVEKKKNSFKFIDFFKDPFFIEKKSNEASELRKRKNKSKKYSKKKLSFLISEQFVKENSEYKINDSKIGVNKSDGNNKAYEHLSKNLKFVADMKDIEKDLGPKPIFKFDADVTILGSNVSLNYGKLRSSSLLNQEVKFEKILEESSQIDCQDKFSRTFDDKIILERLLKNKSSIDKNF